MALDEFNLAALRAQVAHIRAAGAGPFYVFTEPLAGLVSAPAVPLIFVWLCFTLIYFRAPDFLVAFTTTRTLFALGPMTASDLAPWLWLLLPPLGLLHWISYPDGRPTEETGSVGPDRMSQRRGRAGAP
ncbi:MAG: hypothetical protein QNK04_28635 [Myxococcota bacterium]|nr:hypothetical protein [Myxococcota bacterium]